MLTSEAAREALEKLRKSKQPEAQAILRRIAYLRERLMLDCQEGEVIPCPLKGKARAVERKHGKLGNLYCCDLPGFWRLLYTIVRHEGKRVFLVLEVVSHEDYDVWF